MSSPLTLAGRSALAWTPIVGAALVVGFRVFVRLRLNTIGTEDHLMVLSLVFAVISAGLAVALFHSHASTPYELAQLYATGTMASVTASLSTSLAKASVAFLLLRLLGPTSWWKRAFIVVTLIILALVQFLQLIAYFIPSCATPNALRSPTGCLDHSVSNGFFQLWNFYAIVIDITYSTLPVVFINRLSGRKGKNIAITILLSLGWIASIFTLIRTIATFNVWSRYWNALIVPLCTAMEQSLVMITGSLGTLLPLYRYWSSGKPIRPRRGFSSPGTSDGK